MPERRPLLESIDRFTLRTASTIRDFLRAPPDQWTVGESLLTWRSSGGKARVTVLRDGSFTTSAMPDLPGADASLGTGGSELLLRALDTLRAHGEGFRWPPGEPGDSASFALRFERSTISREGEIAPLKARAAFPTMTLNAPWSSPARFALGPAPRYPSAARESNMEAEILLEFVVDAEGRVEMNSVRDANATVELKAWGRPYYDAFVQSARDALGRTRFSPASVGGCAVSQLVRRPFSYSLNH